MFWSTVERTRKDLRDLKSVVGANERLRDLIFSFGSDQPGGSLEQKFFSIQKESPAKSVWALYDHCAAVTRLYAIFEDFVDSIVKEYLEALPGIYPSYINLPATVINQHRLGVAQILSKLGDKGLFKHLSERDALTGISEGNLGRDYVLLPDAFLTDTQNYRVDQVNQVFSYLDIVNIWAGVEKHRALLQYMLSRDSNETPRTILNKLVEDRNFASHSSVSYVMSTPELISLASFLEAAVLAISEIVRKKCISLECAFGMRLEQFHVLHTYSNQIAGVRFLGGNIKIGDSLLVLAGDGAYLAQVTSIRNGSTVLENAGCDVYPELGLGLDVGVRKGDRLVSSHKTALNNPENQSLPASRLQPGRVRVFLSSLRDAVSTLFDAKN